MPRLQLQVGRRAWLLPLLVRQGHQPQTYQRSITTSLLWTDMFEAKAHVSTPLLSAVSCGSLPAMRPDGTDAVVLLREERVSQIMQGDGLRERLGLPRGLRGSASLR